MADVKSTWEELTLPLVRAWAERKFARRPNGDELILDAISLAWEFAQTAGPTAVPNSIAWYAIKRAGAGRQFSQSKRSIDGPGRALRPIERESLDLNECFTDEGDNPADIAAFRLDFAAWVESLNEKQLRVMERLAVGDRTSEAAEVFHCSRGRISQIRQELKASYTMFIG